MYSLSHLNVVTLFQTVETMDENNIMESGIKRWQRVQARNRIFRKILKLLFPLEVAWYF